MTYKLAMSTNRKDFCPGSGVHCCLRNLLFPVFSGSKASIWKDAGDVYANFPYSHM